MAAAGPASTTATSPAVGLVIGPGSAAHVQADAPRLDFGVQEGPARAEPAAWW
ncbi:MAG: hypothetical protein ACYC35_28210 [Pirellulales bacterium]